MKLILSILGSLVIAATVFYCTFLVTTTLLGLLWSDLVLRFPIAPFLLGLPISLPLGIVAGVLAFRRLHT